MLLTECRDEFLYDCECRHLAKGTIRNYRSEIQFLLNDLQAKGIVNVEDVKPLHIRSFLRMKQENGCKPAYINDLLKAYKAMFRYLEEEGYVETNVTSKVKNVRQPKVVIETFSEQEIRRLLGYYSGADYLNVRNKTILAMLFDTGVRCNEMIMMEPGDIATDYIVIRHGKGNKERVVPKSSYLGKLLVKYMRARNGYFAEKAMKHNNLFLSKNGKSLTDEAVARLLKKAAVAVGVAPNIRVSPHTCRHTFAGIQLKNGLDVYSLSRLMGHTNISVTQRYLQGVKDKDIVSAGARTSPLMNL